MTETQRTIIKLIQSGATDKTIIAFTGKVRSYVRRIRTLYATNPHYFDDKTVANKINNDRAKAIKEARERKIERASKFAGEVECLRCEGKFISVDRRYNRICANCKNDRNDPGYYQDQQKPHFIHSGRG